MKKSEGRLEATIEISLPVQNLRAKEVFAQKDFS